MASASATTTVMQAKTYNDGHELLIHQLKSPIMMTLEVDTRQT
jgi:hypothetical protein